MEENNKTGISELTNSEYGSWHWFNTIVSNMKNLAEFLTSKDNHTDKKILTEWGKRQYKEAQELIDYKECINIEVRNDPENILTLKLNYINNESYDGWPDCGRPVIAIIQDYRTHKFEWAQLIRVNLDDHDHEWVHLATGAEFSDSYNVKFWAYLPVLD